MVVGRCLCPCPRTSALIAGILNLLMGLTGLSMIALSPKQRHFLLEPSEELPNTDPVGDILQLFIEYLLPSSGMLLLGVVLILAAVTNNKCLKVGSFLLSTLLMTGCVAGTLSLTLSQVDLVGALPILLVALVQIYVYWVVIVFNQLSYNWASNPRPDDKETLVDSKV